MKIICAREKEIDIFIPQEFWEINIELSDKNGNKINGSLYSESKKRIEKLSVTNEEQAKRLKANLLKNKFKVEDVIKKEKKRSPYSPFSNSLLLQDASSKLGFSPKYTNSLAQELKDGISSLGALITYHRSDSNKMKQNETNNLRKIIVKEIGELSITKRNFL